jgi:hypothetical protein
MSPSLLAVLSRFKGDRIAAAIYCEEMALNYPALSLEYWQYKRELEAHRGTAASK